MIKKKSIIKGKKEIFRKRLLRQAMIYESECEELKKKEEIKMKMSQMRIL